MTLDSPRPEHVGPKVRSLDVRFVRKGTETYALLRDPLGLSEKEMLVPAAFAPLLSLCDGSREIGRLQTGLELLTGQRLPLPHIESFLAQLDDNLLLEGPRFAEAYRQALERYREAPYRPPAQAGTTYPESPDELRRSLEAYCRGATAGIDEGPPAETPASPIIGVICPHIDYQRGWRTYAHVWQRAAPAVQETELAIVFGTDHAGGLGRLTLTRQHYATPLGVLPTARAVVDELAAALGEARAFAEELHHRKEHSIELALTWLHYFLGDRRCEVVPILCGSFEGYLEAPEGPEEDPLLEAALDALRQATAGRRVLVVAAADLAHVGPAFGDRLPLDVVARASLAAADRDLLTAVQGGDATAFYGKVKAELDGRRICGLPPVYLALRFLREPCGVVMGYDQCPADPQGGSLVSIAGAVLQPPI